MRNRHAQLFGHSRLVFPNGRNNPVDVINICHDSSKASLRETISKQPNHMPSLSEVPEGCRMHSISQSNHESALPFDLREATEATIEELQSILEASARNEGHQRPAIRNAALHLLHAYVNELQDLPDSELLCNLYWQENVLNPHLFELALQTIADDGLVIRSIIAASKIGSVAQRPVPKGRTYGEALEELAAQVLVEGWKDRIEVTD